MARLLDVAMLLGDKDACLGVEGVVGFNVSGFQGFALWGPIHCMVAYFSSYANLLCKPHRAHFILGNLR